MEMQSSTKRRWMAAAGLVAVLVAVAFPFLYMYVRILMRQRRSDLTITTGQSTRDRVNQYLEYELNKRLRGLGVALYRRTGGRIARLYGAPGEVLLLTTQGRRSGRERTVMLQGFRDGPDLIIVAANSGRPSHPDWYYNLTASPTARVQIMDRVLEVRAEELPDEAAAAVWPRILQVAPSYARYLRATTRRIPLVRLAAAGRTAEQTVPGGIAQEGTQVGA
jgi:deazaflavin-dependent oxidoreductase (nitroreductase family)